MSRLRPLKLLRPLSWVYGGAVAARNVCFDAGMLATHRSTVPVISVGNITAGGTGKTPLVADIVGRLQSRNRRVGVVSRGYGRRSRGPVVVSGGGRTVTDPALGGDEPVMLAEAFPETTVVVAERRRVAAEIAVDRFGVDVLVMDDGYQHRSLHRDLDIVVVDGRAPLTGVPLLPAGNRREPLRSLRRADLIAISKVATSEEVAAAGKVLRRWSECPLLGFRPAVRGLADLETGGERHVPAGTRVYALSGIGDHRGFLETLRGLGIVVTAAHDAGDHHLYTGDDVAGVVDAARRAGCDMVITTEKDAVRLRTGKAGERARESTVPFVVLRIAADLFFGGEELDRLIQAVLAGKGERC
jgi:tetraacyldisaccharide 4'-kinase